MPAAADDKEAKALAEATAKQDEDFTPSLSLLNADSPDALMQQVDGYVSLDSYKTDENVFSGKRIPVAAKKKLQVPINVIAPGSVVEYTIQSKEYDIAFSVSAKREEGTTVVKVSGW